VDFFQNRQAVSYAESENSDLPVVFEQAATTAPVVSCHCQSDHCDPFSSVLCAAMANSLDHDIAEMLYAGVSASRREAH